MTKKYWEVKYYVPKQKRYGTDTFWSGNPEKWIRDMSKEYPDVDFYEYTELPNPTAKG